MVPKCYLRHAGFQPTLPVRGATGWLGEAFGYCYISTHAPRAGSDQSSFAILHNLIAIFQPTLPVRGATQHFDCIFPVQQHFNPRSPCGERPDCRKVVFKGVQFQPTLPVRGATRHNSNIFKDCTISTHAPRAGSDARTLFCCLKILDFNPRSPCGERHKHALNLDWIINFNPRSPCGERQ